MKLSALLEVIAAVELHGDDNLEITGLTCDSRKVVSGTLFFALRGASTDGHRFIESAVASGAAAIVLEDSDCAPAGVPWLKVVDGRGVMARMAARFNGDPTSGMPLIGITGTNGKTTTTYLIESVLAEAGIRAAVLGTISYRLGDIVFPATHTTPESTELQAMFRRLADAGAKAFIMEVSSHALEQRRVDGCCFDVGVFSNLTRDHLDYHATMEQYLQAKIRLFSELLQPTAAKPNRFAVLNLDDPHSGLIAEQAACAVTGFGVERQGDLELAELAMTVNGISAKVLTRRGELAFKSELLGRFNLSNILAAVAVGLVLDLPLEAISRGVERLKNVPGRMERVENDRGITVLVDYAHTGDALENVLKTVRELTTARIITLFGCGGDRDAGKRPIMGAVAAGMSDLAIVTSDNPRSEDPAKIIAQVREGITPLGIHEYDPVEIADGFEHKGFVAVENRREAIRLAVRVAQAGDVVLLAGKGHEDYQIIGSEKSHFDDREEARMAMTGLGV